MVFLECLLLTAVFLYLPDLELIRNPEILEELTGKIKGSEFEVVTEAH